MQKFNTKFTILLVITQKPWHVYFHNRTITKHYHSGVAGGLRASQIGV